MDIVKRATGIIFISIFLQCNMSWSYFEDTVQGVRPAGMGEAFTSIADDSNAVLFNPAGYARLNNAELNGMYADLFSNLNTQIFSGEDTYYGYHFLSLATPISKYLGVIGLSWSGFHSVLYKENIIALSYAKRLWASYNWDVGINLKAMQWRVEPNEYSTDKNYFPYDQRGKVGVTADIGTVLTLIDRLHIGLCLANIIPSDVGLSTSEYISLKGRLGVSYQFSVPKMVYLNSVQPILEVTLQEDGYNLKAGVEAWLLKDLFALRTGVNIDCYTAGVGISYDLPHMPIHLKIDYAFSLPFQIKDSIGSHRIGMIFQWEPLQKPESKRIEKAKLVVLPETTLKPKPTPNYEKMKKDIKVEIIEEMEKRKRENEERLKEKEKEVEKNEEISRKKRAEKYLVNRTNGIIIGFERKLLSDFANVQDVLEYANNLEIYLEEVANIKIIRQEFTSKSQMIKAFKEGEIDIVLASSDVYKLLKKDNHATPSFRIQINGKKRQQLCLWKLNSASFNVVTDLKGKRLGYINFDHIINLKKNFFPNISEFQNNNYFQEKRQCNSPISALLALQMGEIDILLGLEYMGAVAERLEKQLDQGIQVLAYSNGPALLNASAFSRTYLNEEKMEKHNRLFKALYQAHHDHEAKKFLEFFSADKFIPAQ